MTLVILKLGYNVSAALFIMADQPNAERPTDAEGQPNAERPTDVEGQPNAERPTDIDLNKCIVLFSLKDRK